jgi:hypothetical protein
VVLAICRSRVVWTAHDVVAGPGPWFDNGGVRDWSYCATSVVRGPHHVDIGVGPGRRDLSDEGIGCPACVNVVAYYRRGVP